MSLATGMSLPKVVNKDLSSTPKGILMYDRDFLICFEQLCNKQDEKLYSSIEKVVVGEENYEKPKLLKPISSPIMDKTISSNVKKSQPILIPQKIVRDAASLKREWRQKPNTVDEETVTLSKNLKKIDKKEKPKESDEHRLSQRQKQIDYGKNTVGYENFVKLIPKDKRLKEHPRTPDKYQVCSKRAWDGQVRKWRRQLHAYDPDGELSDDEGEIIDQNEQQDLIRQLDELANATIDMTITPILVSKEVVTVKEIAIITPGKEKTLRILPQAPQLSRVSGSGILGTNPSKSMTAPKAKRNILSDITNRDIKAT